jgi:hypothetical protein
MGGRPVVVLHGYKAVKEVLLNHKNDFSGRGEIPVFEGHKDKGESTLQAVGGCKSTGTVMCVPCCPSHPNLHE